MAEDPSMQKNAATARIERHTQELWKHSIALLRADERAKIVALLRKQADAYEARGDGRFMVAVDVLRDAADAIELGDHAKPEPAASATP